MTPYLVTPPAAQPVTLAEVKDHLRVAHNDDDAEIAAMISTAVAHFDGWSGVLGRCIMPQAWATDFESGGVYILPMPDVVSATVDYGSGPEALALTRTPRGRGGELTGSGVVQFQCAMPDGLLPVATSAIKLHVAREYDAMTGAEYDAHTRAIDALVAAIRWHS